MEAIRFPVPASIVHELKSSVDVTLSIVNTNNIELLRKCLETIKATVRRVSYEVIVVDNASTDGSVEMVTAEFPEFKVIRNTHRQGYGASHNHAIVCARGEYILILNEDMEMLDEAIDRLVDSARRIKTLGVMGCRILNPDRSLQHSCFKFPTLKQELFEALFPYSLALPMARMRSKMTHWEHDTEADVDVVLGCCMLVPRVEILRERGFDPAFFVYSEEHDLCRRMKNRGLRVVFNPSAEMIHVGGQTSKRMSLKMALVQVDSRIRYFHKHKGPAATKLVRGIVALAAAMRLVGWSVLLVGGGGRRASEAKARVEEYWSSLKVVASWKS